MYLQGVVGPQSAQSLPAGTPGMMRLGQLNDTIVSELHGRFYEANYRGTLFSVGNSVAALTANSYIGATLDATIKPVLAVWNPTASTVNVVLAQAAIMSVWNTWTTPTGCGLFVAATSTGNAAITTGVAPLNRKTLTAVGSQAKGFPGGTTLIALTGLTSNLVLQEAIEIPAIVGTGAYGTPSAPTAVQYNTMGGVVNFDGTIIVPPGGVYAILAQISTTTTSVTGRLVWEEVPI